LRDDGSRTTAQLGPGLPHHDLAHYVVERYFGLRHGFFGNVASGYTLEALSDKAVIRALGAESWLAEVLARAVGSLATGACTFEQFPTLISEELVHRGIQMPERLTAAAGAEMLRELNQLIERYDSLANGESLSLRFGFSAHDE